MIESLQVYMRFYHRQHSLSIGHSPGKCLNRAPGKRQKQNLRSAIFIQSCAIILIVGYIAVSNRHSSTTFIDDIQRQTVDTAQSYTKFESQ